jgi:hypothetical protein
MPLGRRIPRSKKGSEGESMATIVPEEKKVQDALKWISARRGEREIEELIREAAFRFNLTPKNEEYLYRLLREEDPGQEGS